MNKKDIKEDKEIIVDRENVRAMKRAAAFSSRGTGFYLAGMGVMVQWFHMFLAFTIVSPFTNTIFSGIVSFIGATFLSGALLYFVSRSSGNDESNTADVDLFTRVEIALGLIFYLDKLIYKPLINGAYWSEINYPQVAMGILLAIFIPKAIKKYAAQVRATEPIVGEKHDLTATDRLLLKNEISSMIDGKLQDYTNDYNILFDLLNETKEAFDGDISWVCDHIKDIAECLREEIYDLRENLFSDISKIEDGLLENKIISDESQNEASEAMDIAIKMESWVDESSGISENLLNNLEGIIEKFQSDLELGLDERVLEKMDSMAELIDSFYKSGNTRLVEQKKRIEGNLNKKCALMVEMVQRKAVAKAKVDLEEEMRGMMQQMVQGDLKSLAESGVLVVGGRYRAVFPNVEGGKGADVVFVDLDDK